MKIGYNIRKARVVARRSQEELAGAAGINRTYLSQLENGHSSPTLDVVEKLARALGMSPTELLADAPAAREPEPQYELDADTLMYPGLVELLSDKRTRLLMKPTAEEVEVLRGIRFLNRFSPSKELFVEILLDYRRRKSEGETEPTPES